MSTGTIGGMAGLLGKQADQPSRRLKHSMALNAGKIACELQYITHPLFSVHQKRPVTERLTLPLRLRKRTAGNGARAESLLPSVPGFIRRPSSNINNAQL